MEVYFSFIKESILTCNYPLSHSMTDEELADIFKTSNRCFLISWILKLLDNTYEEILERSENDKEVLGNMVYELGFCAQKDKLPFMTGQLPFEQQVKIIYNIFSYITDLKKYPSEEKKNISNDELITLTHTNLNLFPMYGEIKLLNSSERDSKLIEFKEEINYIKAKISTENIALVHTGPKHEFTEDIKKFLEKLKLEIPKMKSVVENLNKNNDVKEKVAIQVHPHSDEMLKECSKNLKTISQFIKDLSTIQDFVKSRTEISESVAEKDNDVYDMLKLLYQEALSVKKYSRSI